MQTDVNAPELSGIFLGVPDIDAAFSKVSDRVLIVNRVNVKDPEEMERLNRLLYTQFDGDVLDTTPSCDCGKYHGEKYKGMECEVCFHIVSAVTERPLESLLWFETPKGIDRFIAPQVWTVLSEFFKVKKTNNVIRWLCDQSYVMGDKPTVSKLQILTEELRWKRNINHFVRNFDLVIKYLLDKRIGGTKPAISKQYLMQYIEAHRHKFFPKHLPVPNRAVFIIEKSPLGTWTDPTLPLGLDAVRTMTGIENSFTPLSQRQIENHTVKAVRQLAEYYDAYMDRNLSGKPGMFRRQFYGGRLDFSIRAVISSIADRHDYDELHLPWGVAVMLFETHLTSKLDKMGMKPRAIKKLLSLYTKRYHPTIDKLFKELIAESPFKGLPLILQRNPSLTRGSAQLFYVTKIFTDTNIRSIALSILVLKSFNADSTWGPSSGDWCRNYFNCWNTSKALTNYNAA